MRRWPVVAIVVLGAAGCQRRPPAPVVEAAPHYVVGTPWQGTDGAWFYPKEQFDLHQTGLAIVEPTPASPLTADGERYDPASPAAAHQTLQLPAILRVTNLENGRQLLVRVDDRGPPSPGRLLAVTPAAARRLNMAAGVPTRVAIDLDSTLSREVAGEVAGGPHLDIVAAPVQGVQEQPLDAPGSPPGSGSMAAAGPPASPTAPSAGRPDQTVQPVSTTVRQGIPDPGALWIDAGQFSQRIYADEVAATVEGAVDSQGSGRETVYTVRIGPFQTVPAADAALDRARRAGVTGARIVVD